MTTVTSQVGIFPVVYRETVERIATERLEQARVAEREALETLVSRMQETGAGNGIGWKASAAVEDEMTRRLWEGFVEALAEAATVASIEEVVANSMAQAEQIAFSVCRTSHSTSDFSNVVELAKAAAAVEFRSRGLGYAGLPALISRALSETKHRLATVEYLALSQCQREHREAVEKLGRARTEASKASCQVKVHLAEARVEEAKSAVLAALAAAGLEGAEVY